MTSATARPSPTPGSTLWTAPGTYGASAPYQRIYDEYGITATAVADAARDSIAATR